MLLQKKLPIVYISVIVILLIILLTTVSGILYFQREQMTIEEALRDAEGLSTLLGIEQWDNDSTNFKKSLEQYTQNTKRQVLLFDESGKLLTSSLNNISGKSLNPEISEVVSETLLYKTPRTAKIFLFGKKKSFVFTLWKTGSSNNGVIMMEYLHDSVVQLTIYRVLLFGGLILILGFIATKFIHSYTQKTLIKPLNDLIAGIGKIQNGQQGYRIQENNNDELGQIIVAFNSMASDIETAYHKLENEVKELQKANDELKQLEELKTVAKFSSTLLSTPNLEEILELALKHICSQFGARAGAVILIDIPTLCVQRRINYGLSEEYKKFVNRDMKIPIKNNYIEEVLKQNTPWVISNVFKDPRFAPWRDLAKTEKYTGFISVQLIAREEKLGVINLYYDHEINPDEREMNLLTVMADQLSIAILRSKVEEGISIRAKQMTALHEFSQRIGANLKLEYTLQIVLEEVTKLLNIDYGLIRLINKETQELMISATYGIPDNEKSKLPILHIGLGVAGEIAKVGKPIYVRDVNIDARFRNYTPLDGQISYLGVPLRVGEKIIGVLSCMTKVQRIFTDDEISYLSIMSSEAGIAIENARLYSETKELSLTDALTQLNNVRRLQSQLDDELARAERYGRFVSFVMMDIDHFKKYNDKHGHPRGDIVLQKVAELMKQHVRDIDRVYRYGGEELCILLPETDKETAYQVTERVRQVVSEYPFYGELTQPGGNLTISGGVATYPQDALTKEGLISRADQALYKAKALGRNRVVFYTGENKKS